MTLKQRSPFHQTYLLPQHILFFRAHFFSFFCWRPSAWIPFRSVSKIAVRINTTPKNPPTNARRLRWKKRRHHMTPMITRKSVSILPTFFVLTRGSIFLSLSCPWGQKEDICPILWTSRAQCPQFIQKNAEIFPKHPFHHGEDFMPSERKIWTILGIYKLMEWPIFVIIKESVIYLNDAPSQRPFAFLLWFLHFPSHMQWLKSSRKLHSQIIKGHAGTFRPEGRKI